jgi:hypothetical protein
MGFKSFWSAQKLIDGIEIIHMVKNGQMHCPNGQSTSVADQFYSLAFSQASHENKLGPSTLL